MDVKENVELMKTLDDAWNAQDWDVFQKRHAANTAVYWPGQPEPTRGRHNHLTEAKEFFKMFDNSLENNPYMVMFGQDDWTCTIAKWKGTMIGPMRGADGKMIPATHKSFSLEFCTVARWRNGEIVEEKLFYDQVGLLKQIGVM